MKRFFMLPSDMDIRGGGDSNVIHVYFEHDTVANFCLELALLHWDMIEALVVSGNEGPFQLEIRKEPRFSEYERGRVRLDTDRADLEISRRELELWITFFLQYYRDGVGDADHIDVHLFTDAAEGPSELFMSLNVPKTRPPISQEELKRQLGLPLRRESRRKSRGKGQ